MPPVSYRFTSTDCTAARMASTGAVRPDQRSTWSAAWCTSMPRPSTVAAPAAAGGGEQRRLERVVHEVGDDLARAQTRRRRAASTAPSPAMPIGRGVHDDVGARRAASSRSVQATVVRAGERGRRVGARPAGGP